MVDLAARFAEELANAVLATARVVHLRPARPKHFRTPRGLWAWAALGLPCREPDDNGRRCGTCAPCKARRDAIRTWCP